jgi:hypothetical protein
LIAQATINFQFCHLSLSACHSGAAFCLGDPLVSAPHALPRYQHASRLIAAIERQPLRGPDPPSAGGVARPFGPAVLHFP